MGAPFEGVGQRYEPLPEFTVRYCDADWEELDHLTFSPRNARSTLAAVNIWLAYVEGKADLGPEGQRALMPVRFMIVEVHYGS